MHRKAVLAGAATLAVTAALLAAGPTSAAEPTNVDYQSLRVAGVPVRTAPAAVGTFVVTGKGKTTKALDDESMQDLATYAKESGRDLSAVVAAHQGIHEFSAYIARLEETMPDVFVQAGLEAPDKAGGNWIQFTAMPSADIVAGLERLPVATEVQYGAPASSKELADLSYTLTKSLAARPDVIRSSGAYYDYKQRVMRLQYTPAEGAQLNTLGSVFQAALAASTVAGQLPIDVVLEVTPDVSVTEVTVQGGRDLNLASGAAHCTAGFTAVRNGNRGLLTARHCNDALRYGNTAGVISTNPALTNNSTIDFQFHRTLTGNGHTTNKQFRATNRTEDGDRTVTAVANAPVNSTVCHWGRTSGYRCTSVASTNVCRTFTSGQQWCGLDVTAANVSAGGDSGGPWFFGNTARGGHTGASSSASLFTRIGRVANHLNATVLQN